MLVENPVEIVTAVTDLLMSAAGIFGAVTVYRTGAQTWKAGLWISIFGLFSLASVAGAIHHGIALDPTTYDFTWQVVFFTLGVLVGLFVVALVYDLKGFTIARRVLPVMVLVAIGFFCMSLLLGQDYRLFLVYEAAALAAALLGYGYLAFLARPGMVAMTAGVLLTIVAAVVQATEAISLVPTLPFDHNAAYHLIQLVGLSFLVSGVLRSMTSETASL